MKATGIILLLLVWHTGFSQWNDNFLDGDFVFNPSWNGDTANFIIENTALRLFAPAIDSTSYLSTPSTLINNGSWQFSVHLDFNPSSNNYAKIYLVSSSDVLTGSLNGYFVKIGNTADEISLYRQDGMVAVEIIDGLDGRVGLSVVDVTILATRNLSGEWQLSSRLSTETNWYLEGSTLDNTYLASSWFGVNCTYTSTRSTKFYFDNFIVSGSPYIDKDPPEIDTAFATAQAQIIIKFNEAVDSITAGTSMNYSLNQQASPIAVAVSDSSAIVDFGDTLQVINQLAISGVEDMAGNIIADTVVKVIYVDLAPLAYGDIIINEIMADPTPAEDLPEVEYIELYNASAKAIGMTGWSYSDKISVANIPASIILPDSILILTKISNITLLNTFGQVIGLQKWPSLNNTGDSLSLSDSTGRLVDRVVYDESWYRDDTKDAGGWSLERINPYHPCSGYLNWSASKDPNGGTPGKTNAVLVDVDIDPPKMLGYTIKENEAIIGFDEPLLDSLNSITTIPDNTVSSVEVAYNQLAITFVQPFLSEETNKISIAGITDCFGNKADSLHLSFIPDFSAPKIDSVYTQYPDILEVIFNEPVQLPTIDDFMIDSLMSPLKLVQNPDNPLHISLYFDTTLENGESYVLGINSLTDVFGNTSRWLVYPFVYKPLRHPTFGELLISEIMADPTPSVNLPEVEYLEVTNKSTEPLLLKDLILADAKDAVVIPTGIILPEERVLLTKTTAVDTLSAYATTIGIPNWPTLNNTGDNIAILGVSGDVINSVYYSKTWYRNEEKADGGWSLELIDESNYCGGEKVWTASESLHGGTPGQVNSVLATVPDLNIPHVAEAFAFTDDSILIRFDKPLTNRLPEFSSTGLNIIEGYFDNYQFDECILRVEPMQPRIAYELFVSKITDCRGNINLQEEVTIILPEIAEPGDVVVSEVLFNPPADGVDFIEVYNNSPKYISLYNWSVSNTISDVTIESKDLLYPYSFRVFTKDQHRIFNLYPKAILGNIFEQDIPAMANDEGTLAIYNAETLQIDSVYYQEQWHFPFLDDVEGVSLERIDMDKSGTLSSNWASASSLDNFATPGYVNSQALGGQSHDVVILDPQVIVPDGNGRDDFTTIIVSEQNAGSLVTINIFNLTGQPVKTLANNILSGSQSKFIWDGTDKSGAVVPLGHYIIVVEMISGDARTSTYRKKVVVANGF